MIRIIGAGLRGGGNLLSTRIVGEMEIEGRRRALRGIVAELLLSAFWPQGGDRTGAAPSSLAASQALGHALDERVARPP